MRRARSVDLRLCRQVGLRLKRIRVSYGLTLDEIARRTGVSKSHLSTVERGRCDITISVLFRWTRGLGMSVREFASEIRALDNYGARP